MKTILITGLIKEDSGKTFFAHDLSRYYKSQGLTVIPFKPLSGHNFYFHHHNTQRNIEQGNILSKDIQFISQSLEKKNLPPLEVLNPCHVLFTEKKVDHFIQTRRIATYYNSVTRSVPILHRCSVVKNDGAVKHHYAKLKPSQWKNLLIDAEIVEQVHKRADSLQKYTSDQHLADFSSQYSVLAFNSTYNYLKDLKPDVFLIEGFNNIASPITVDKPNIKSDIDLIITVGPGSLLVFDIERYFQVVEEYKNYSSNKVATLENILEYIKPVDIIEMPLGGYDDAFFKKLIENKLKQYLNSKYTI